MKPDPRQKEILISVLKKLSPLELHKVLVFASTLMNIRMEKQKLQ